jgi:hypothetical protein
MKLSISSPRLEFVQQHNKSATKFWPCVVFDVVVGDMTVDVVRRAVSAALYARHSRRPTGTPVDRLTRVCDSIAGRANALTGDRDFVLTDLPSRGFGDLVPMLGRFAVDANARQPADPIEVERAGAIAATALRTTATRLNTVIDTWERHGIVEIHDSGWFTQEIRKAMARISAEYFHRPHVVIRMGDVVSSRITAEISGRQRADIAKLEAPLHMLHAARPNEVGWNGDRWSFAETGLELFKSWHNNFYTDPVYRSIMGVRITS